jgi:hypothetical protein
MHVCIQAHICHRKYGQHAHPDVHFKSLVHACVKHHPRAHPADFSISLSAQYVHMCLQEREKEREREREREGGRERERLCVFMRMHAMIEA